jgi:anaerobic magnesium-protoporphyrin IX monomethyl ester cyclase
MCLLSFAEARFPDFKAWFSTGFSHFLWIPSNLSALNKKCAAIKNKQNKIQHSEFVSVMKVCLLLPPISDPRGPHLAPAALAAALRTAGYEVILKDIDLEMALYLLNPVTLKEHVQTATAKLKALDIHQEGADWETLTWRQRLSQSIDDARVIIPQIPEHLQVLQSNEFYERNAYFAARKAIDRALAMICAVYDYSLRYKMDGQVFATRYREYRLDELLQAVENPEANLFGSFYPSVVIPKICAENPDLVGISILNFQQVIPGLTLAKQLKQKGLRVVIGGTVYTKFVESLKTAPAFFTLCDAAVVYEGETALIALMQAIEKNPAQPDLSNVPNILWFDGTNVRVNEPFQAEDLSRLPAPDFAGLPLDSYLAPSRVLPYNLGKGCYWNRCRFCEIPFINNLAGSSYRSKPAPLIVNQLQELAQRYATPYFQFTDESCSPELLEEIAEIISERNLQLRYLCYARLENGFTAERLKKLHASGLRKLMFGLESGSDQTLKKINKGITAAQAEQVLVNCREAGVKFRLFVILGFPGETLEHAWETRNFLRRVAPLLRDPLNSVEVNLFHLDSNSCYGRHSTEFGISWPEKEAGEFYLGGDRFSCRDGMDKQTLHQFISEVREEIYQLAAVPLKHSGWEEYSLLTICHGENEKVNSEQ